MFIYEYMVSMGLLHFCITKPLVVVVVVVGGGGQFCVMVCVMFCCLT